MINFKKILHSFRKQKIRAIYEDDLKELLVSLGVLDSIEKNKMFCANCKNTINFKNIEAIFLEKGEIKFICSNYNCITKYGTNI